MQDKVLSGLDRDISNILNSEDSDEIKAKNYVTALTRFKNYSNPPKTEEQKITPAAAAAAVPAVPAVPTVTNPLKRKRVKMEPPKTTPSLSPKLWRRTQRQHKKKNFGSQWIDYSGRTKDKKSRGTWIEL
jgi:hypothetical protein